VDAWIRPRWRGLLDRLELQGPGAEALAALEAGYASPGRAYHTWAHIRRCLEELDATPPSELDPLLPPALVEAALWYHDAVYDPGGADNESRSASLARDALRSLGLRRAAAERVELLVLATAHGSGSPDPEGAAALVRDIDLAILGAPEPEFDAYSRAIRFEYAGVADAAYRSGRRAVLQSFLRRPRIYLTPRLHEEREARARGNLVRALAGLVEPSDGPPGVESRKAD
jgi:predicted metal-dependent HD superfamily phosphohydrolase